MTTMHLHSRLGASLISAAVVFAFFPLIASATTGLKIQPVKIDETLNPGQSISGTITLGNVSDTPINVAVNVQDFVPLAGADTIQFVGRTPGVSSVRDWISVAGGSSFTLKLGETKEIPYTITAPADAEPGGHFGVVFFKATIASTGQSLNVGTQVGMLVLVNIPGSHTETGKILDFTAPPFSQSAPISFMMHFQNTGTAYFEPQGEIKITDMFGRNVGTVPIGGIVVLPTTIKKMEFAWEVSGFLIGRYTALATIRDGEGNVLTSDSVSFWIVPVWYIAGFLVTLIVLFFLLRFIKRNVKISVSVK